MIHTLRHCNIAQAKAQLLDLERRALSGETVVTANVAIAVYELPLFV